MSEDGSTLARRQLGKYLRNGREECGFTLQQVAELIERSASTLQRMETGVAAHIRTPDLEALCKIYGFGPEQSVAMKGLARQGNEQNWWYEYGDLLPENFDFYVGLEASAQQLTTYEPELVPGLLQTPAYASAMIRSVYPDEDPHEHARRVKLRMRRQIRITRKHQPAALDVILRESSLCGVVGGAKVMGAQMRYLLDMDTRSNVGIQILPFSAGFPLGVSAGPFVILGFGHDRQGHPAEPPVVYIESYTGDLYLTKPDAIRRYHEAYEGIRRCAMNREASRALLRKMAKEFGA
ncbi:helix-turn-helix domain-containing protein [Nocardia callitridis]|uniref:Helix-turn-helix transcriptional regulator n=1 Tax=Nocardia callitridis TaxID=648753 RepID=A0ABP9JS49_9NOCA